jgi:hypothetical protein
VEDFRGEVSNRRETVVANSWPPDVGGDSMFGVLDELCSYRKDSHSGWTDAVHDIHVVSLTHWGGADESRRCCVPPPIEGGGLRE